MESTVDNFLSNREVRISPLVLMSILDIYARKPRKEHRAIGTLLGHVSEGNVLEVADCFQVVHQDTPDKGVQMNIPYHQRVCALRQAVHPKEVVIGWFSVGQGSAAARIDENTCSIQNFYKTKDSKFQANPQLNFTAPVYLQVDTDLREGEKPISIKCFSSEQVVGTDTIMHFLELPVSTVATAQQGGQDANIMEMLVWACMNNYSAGEPVEIREFDAFRQQLADLEQVFVRAKQYCKDVSEERQPANPEVGRALLRALSAESSALGDEKLQELVAGVSKDTLMVSYLSTTCKTQILLSEKIQAILSKAGGEN